MIIREKGQSMNYYKKVTKTRNNTPPFHLSYATVMTDEPNKMLWGELRAVANFTRQAALDITSRWLSPGVPQRHGR